MGDKKQNSFQLNWSSTQNANPLNLNPSVNLSGVNTGAMASTNTIYSNVQAVPYQDNIGIELSWTGTPTGTISVLVSESGNVFIPLTFSPTIAQPAGSAGNFAININQLPFRYFMLEYVNASGTGVLTAWVGQKDVN